MSAMPFFLSYHFAKDFTKHVNDVDEFDVTSPELLIQQVLN